MAAHPCTRLPARSLRRSAVAPRTPRAEWNTPVTTPRSTTTAPSRFLLLGDSHAVCAGQAARAAELPFAGGPAGSGRVLHSALLSTLAATRPLRAHGRARSAGGGGRAAAARRRPGRRTGFAS